MQSKGTRTTMDREQGWWERQRRLRRFLTFAPYVIFAPFIALIPLRERLPRQVVVVIAVICLLALTAYFVIGLTWIYRVYWMEYRRLRHRPGRGPDDTATSREP